MSLSLIIGSGILSLLCFYFAFEVDEKHFLLKFLFVLFGLIFMFMVGVGISQGTVQTCDVFITSETVNGSTTSFDRAYSCFDTGFDSGANMITLTASLFILFGLYISVYIVKEVFDWRRLKTGKK